MSTIFVQFFQTLVGSLKQLLTFLFVFDYGRVKKEQEIVKEQERSKKYVAQVKDNLSKLPSSDLDKLL